MFAFPASPDRGSAYQWLHERAERETVVAPWAVKLVPTVRPTQPTIWDITASACLTLSVYVKLALLLRTKLQSKSIKVSVDIRPEISQFPEEQTGTLSRLHLTNI